MNLINTKLLKTGIAAVVLFISTMLAVPAAASNAHSAHSGKLQFHVDGLYVPFHLGSNYGHGYKYKKYYIKKHHAKKQHLGKKLHHGKKHHGYKKRYYSKGFKYGHKRAFKRSHRKFRRSRKFRRFH